MILDTSFVIDALRGKPAATKLMRELETGSDVVRIPTVVGFELWEGVERSRWPAAEREQVEATLAAHAPLQLTTAHAKRAGLIAAALSDRGDPIGDVDLLLAGTAVEEGDMLVTRNKRDFERVPGLRLKAY